MKIGVKFKMSSTLIRVSFAVIFSRIGTQLTLAWGYPHFNHRTSNRTHTILTRKEATINQKIYDAKATYPTSKESHQKKKMVCQTYQNAI